jgi:hypothetical protein
MGVGAVSSVGGGLQTGVQAARTGGAERLSPQEQAQVRRLQAIDQKVRQHEAAHKAAGAGLTGAATYQYVRGPDGRQYAVSGEVSINTSPASTPQATLIKAEQIRAAALAPADPSPQDQAVAAAAAMMALQARQEIARQRNEGEDGGGRPAASAVQGGPNGNPQDQGEKAEKTDKAMQAYSETAQAITQALGQAVNAFA